MAELYDLFSRRAFGLAYRILGDGSEAEDVVQDTFLTLWRYADRVDPARGRLTAFLLTVTHRRAIDVLRARRQRERRLAPFDPSLDAPDDVDVEATAVANVDGTFVRECLGQLPVAQRQILELAYFEAYTHVEIAERLSLPLGTVKSRIRLGLEKMREAIRAR